MSDKILELKNATKYYGDKKVLNDINIELSSGKILGLIGPSGSGKTTTIKCLMGMESLNEGYAKIFDTNMPNRKLLNDIGYMGQSDALYESLSARENLVFFGNLMGLKGKELKQAITDNMKLVNLENELDKTVSNFSGGMKRRLSLAITLLSNPNLIILDEPTVGIDPSLRKEIWKQLRELTNKDKSVIVTTHVMDEAERCDYVGLIVNGKLFTIGTPQELKEKFKVDSIEEVFIKAELEVKS
ncbi:MULTISPECIES: ABC transporter ATP-binding protein [Staphylococcus]|jgi:ABC-type multidrug transport system, ATPase component|uniref:ABC transporter ecsA-like protein n=1 Tax=Staphylococcus epidermidis (strain ATCC 12228 / FDA PCI 1200) TaxID=176280 RepID=A0A0H2VGR8_STAES|nr:ABC transporter ATP-binding protein [Staphylococcus epidermidis]MBF9297555.1 ABC transporter ATP-binding protein [Staphylococcus schleiferi]MDU4493430.1 ABC transporter ATP-binding protein [Staphylococcus warneri]MDU5816753.1 ABC transporter ATP-binding protein [Staphylococcus sp.]MDU6090710.1 ABC transporter ATP-binding protein [Staphylococcus lugdunensis]AAO03691.1 ABC transporter ecsA-like protein [Staphylococcus epidermidis ATCC 12228]